MSESFTKLFSSITDSSIWAEDDGTRIVWVTLLAMADKRGYIGAAIPGIAARARVSLEVAERALEKFQQPDRYSRSQEHEGRRLAPAERGWQLLNYPKFREKLDEETRKENNRLYQQACRERQKLIDARESSSSVLTNADCQQSQQSSAQAEAEAEADPERDREEERESAERVTFSRSSRNATPAARFELAELEARYDRDLLDRSRACCALARKNGKMADGRWLVFLRDAAKYPVGAVEAAMRTFCEKHADGDKAEKYLLGIVRGESKALTNGKAARPDPETLERVKKYYARLLDSFGTKPSWADANVRDAEVIARWAGGFGEPQAALSQAFHGFEADSWAKQNGYPIANLARNIAKYHLAGSESA